MRLAINHRARSTLALAKLYDVRSGTTISLLSAVIGGAIVASVTRRLTRRREAEKRKTEKAIEYRIEAWRAIADQMGRPLDADSFEKALSEIVLFGTEQEVQLVSQIMDEFVASQTSDTTELLRVLRQNIRLERGMPKTSFGGSESTTAQVGENKRSRHGLFLWKRKQTELLKVAEFSTTLATSSACPLPRLRGRVRERAMPGWRVTPKMRARARSLRRDQTNAERIVWFALRTNRLGGVKFRRQIPMGPYIVDFVSSEKMLIVEIDGGQHYEDGHEARDAHRDRYLAAKGYKVLRFSNHEVMSNRSGVFDTIFRVVGQTLSPTLPRPRGREQTGPVAP